MTDERDKLQDVGQLDRTTYCGGRDVAAIVGVDQYRTPLACYLDKIGEAPPERPDPKRDARLRRGKLWEPIIVDMLREEHAIEVVARNHRYVDREFPFMAAEIDFEWRRPESAALINGEVKSVNPMAAKRWGPPETDEVPADHLVQSQWGLMITGRELCQYAVVFGADDLTLYHAQRDDAVIAWLRDEVRRFWEHNVANRIPPRPRTLADVAALWPRDSGATREVTPEIAALFSSYRTMRERINETERVAEALQLEILEWMQTATTATINGAPLFTCKTHKRTALAQSELKLARPDVFKEFSRTTEYRVLRKARKDDDGNPSDV